MPQSKKVNIDGNLVSLTNLDKPLWPSEGYTKADLIFYISEIADILLPHLKDRPLTVTRYPNGIEDDFFYQKNCPAYAPDWVETHAITLDTDPINYVVVQNKATLIWLANQACIELHPALYTIHTDLHPNVVIFDLDPAEGASFEDVRVIAGLLKDTLDHLSLKSFPKTSGSSGLHIYVPIEPKYTFKETSTWVGKVGEMLVKLYPEKVTTERLVRNRTGKVYVDHLQNLAGKTIVSVYSPRPKPGAPVSTPIRWEELNDVKPTTFNIKNGLERIHAVGDLFSPLLSLRQNLDEALAMFGVRQELLV